MRRRSRAQSANGIDSANDVTSGVGRISFADVGQCLWVAEDRQGFLELGQVLWAKDDGDRPSVARDRDALVLVLDAVYDFAEVIPDVAKRFNRHAHNCGALPAVPQVRGPNNERDQEERRSKNGFSTLISPLGQFSRPLSVVGAGSSRC
jgi:hypothetical protein